jgi:hypothetical protein
MSFRDTSLRLTQELSIETKRANGIFFTPKEARDQIFTILKRHSLAPASILEPSFGSGEFLEDLYQTYPSATITGVEKNKELFESSTRLNIFNQDFFDYVGTHDLVIGNPPYFVIPKTHATSECQEKRPNICIQFLYKSLRDHTNPNGVVAFVLPTSIFNCGYYERMRRYLFENTTILAVESLAGSYLETEQSTVALVVQRGKKNDDYFVKRNGCCYISPFYKELAEMLKNTYTLDELGYDVKTGEVVWNQHKDKLVDTGGALLIYSSNFTRGTITLGGLKTPKKQYIAGFTRPPLSGKCVLINRGYGNTSYTLTCTLADYPSYFAENHVNVVRPRTSAATSNIESVMKSLRSDKTAQFIRMFVGNGALSKTEIHHCVPIWLD